MHPLRLSPAAPVRRLPKPEILYPPAAFSASKNHMGRLATYVLPHSPMADRIIAMPGSGHFDLRRLTEAAAEFGFRVETAEDSRRVVTGPEPRREIAAVLFHRDALSPRSSWFDTIWALRSDLPGVRLVACHGFGEAVDWELLSGAGAYHVLWLPFKESELRQCLGFIWDAEHAEAEAESDALATQTLYRIPMGRVSDLAPQLRSCTAA